MRSGCGGAGRGAARPRVATACERTRGVLCTNTSLDQGISLHKDAASQSHSNHWVRSHEKNHVGSLTCDKWRAPVNGLKGTRRSVSSAAPLEKVCVAPQRIHHGLGQNQDSGLAPSAPRQGLRRAARRSTNSAPMPSASSAGRAPRPPAPPERARPDSPPGAVGLTASQPAQSRAPRRRRRRAR
jgi:hypothetical protein